MMKTIYPFVQRHSDRILASFAGLGDIALFADGGLKGNILFASAGVTGFVAAMGMLAFGDRARPVTRLLFLISGGALILSGSDVTNHLKHIQPEEIAAGGGDVIAAGLLFYGDRISRLRLLRQKTGIGHHILSTAVSLLCTASLFYEGVMSRRPLETVSTIPYSLSDLTGLAIGRKRRQSRSPDAL